MKYLYGLAILCCLVLWSSCRNDFETVPSTGSLEFSRDTVFLDTIFTNIGSSTYNLTVYNRSDEDISVPNVGLADGENSNYRLNVDGLPGKTFENVQIRANDSIFIFIETTFDVAPTNELEFLYTDQIVFDSGANEQKVELVTLVQDAIFLFPEDLGNGMFETLNLGTDEEGNDILIEGFFLDNTELTFTNEKPYVIYGFAAVPPGETLEIQPGARVHFHENSGILVANTGSIKANGQPSSDPEVMEGEIIFESDRLEPGFSDIPGQWGTIWCTAGSTDNEFSYVTIKNAIVGIRMDSNDGDETLSLSNVQIYNSSFFGIQTLTGNIYGENVVINNSGLVSLNIGFGGTYTFNHCTFANYWTNSFRSFPTLILDNSVQTGETTFETMPLSATFNNCIVFGNEQREYAIVREGNDPFNFSFTNSLMRFEDPDGEFADNPLYSDPAFYPNTIFNQDPLFQDTENNNFNIEQGASAAQGIGANGVPPATDLNGTPRATPPDAGAYEATVFPDPEG
ncbi:hypothetical protein [Patiriisocius hiemis]|uniref:Right handed beta helix domain-containing protein n=1 Tax=Patiriisocius hiemis TaxID=3075604 RepID=A0ABU2YA06_9FLAO|nr:hypothetical protein [Constantimarinum sp. W242]MDT0554567.1 hypothetical protein [Constantimarinum sp. W242]